MVQNIAPLLIFIILGISNVFAPGNLDRQGAEGNRIPVIPAIIEAFIDVIKIAQDIIVDHPLAVILFVLLIVLGIVSNPLHKEERGLIVFLIVWLLTVLGSILPYVYGRGFLDGTVDVRMRYIVEYLFIIGAALWCVKLGKWISYSHQVEITKTSVMRLALVFGMTFYVSVINTYQYLSVVQVDILRSMSLIKESYSLWDGILLEIEQSDNKDVEIYRNHKLQWTKYFTYSGIEDNVVYNVPLDTIYAPENGQQLFNVYYGKETILLRYNDEEK